MRGSWAQVAAGVLVAIVAAGLFLLPGRVLGPSQPTITPIRFAATPPTISVEAAAPVQRVIPPVHRAPVHAQLASRVVQAPAVHAAPVAVAYTVTHVVTPAAAPHRRTQPARHASARRIALRRVLVHTKARVAPKRHPVAAPASPPAAAPQAPPVTPPAAPAPAPTPTPAPAPAPTPAPTPAPATPTTRVLADTLAGSTAALDQAAQSVVGGDASADDAQDGGPGHGHDHGHGGEGHGHGKGNGK